MDVEEVEVVGTQYEVVKIEKKEFESEMGDFQSFVGSQCLYCILTEGLSLRLMT